MNVKNAYIRYRLANVKLSYAVSDPSLLFSERCTAIKVWIPLNLTLVYSLTVHNSLLSNKQRSRNPNTAERYLRSSLKFGTRHLQPYTSHTLIDTGCASMLLIPVRKTSFCLSFPPFPGSLLWALTIHKYTLSNAMNECL